VAPDKTGTALTFPLTILQNPLADGITAKLHRANYWISPDAKLLAKTLNGRVSSLPVTRQAWTGSVTPVSAYCSAFSHTKAPIRSLRVVVVTRTVFSAAARGTIRWPQIMVRRRLAID
jgi:hypothetical protein